MKQKHHEMCDENFHGCSFVKNWVSVELLFFQRTLVLNELVQKE